MILYNKLDYSNPGFGEQGEFYLDPTNNISVNEINWFGVKDDEITIDDTLSFQAAMDFCFTIGWTIYIPPTTGTNHYKVIALKDLYKYINVKNSLTEIKPDFKKILKN